MKLIIDMPEDIWADMKKGRVRLGEIADTVAKGIVPKKGTWKPEHCIDNDCRGCHNKCTWFVCSECGAQGNKDDNFCRHCGADMRGAEHETDN